VRTVNEVFEMTKDLEYKDNELLLVKDYPEFIKIIKDNYKQNNALPEIISFDHDIGEDYTGKDCAKWFIDFCIDNKLEIPKIKIHSLNPVGKQNIANLFSDYQKFSKKPVPQVISHHIGIGEISVG